MKKVKFIYNPYSGESKIKNKLDDIIRIYQSYGYTLIPFRIGSKVYVEDAFKDDMNQYEHILISGGDGTIDRVVNNIRKNNLDIPIGVLPSGTANDFAKMLDIKGDIEANIKNIINMPSKKIDIGKINDDYFINVASAGMFTDVSQRINTDFKHSMGKVSYYMKGIEDALNLRKFKISVSSDEFCYEGDMYLMLIFNGKTAGNLNLAYKSEIDDGLLDVIIFKAMPIPKTLHMLIKVIMQEHLEKEDDIIYFRTKRVIIGCNDDLITDIDGERGPNFPLDIQCIKDGLEVLGVK